MSAENKAIVQRVVEEVYNQGNLDVLDELFATGFTYHDPLTPGEGVDLERFREFVACMHSALPDINPVTEEVIAEGDTVAQPWRWSATHQGELLDVQPTGKQIDDHGLARVPIRDGKVTELRIAPDALGVLQQRGAVPEMERVATWCVMDVTGTGKGIYSREKEHACE